MFDDHKKKILITGVSGLLGNNLAYYSRERYTTAGLYCSHAMTLTGVDTHQVDLLKRGEFEEVVGEFKPDILIHCAALADVDQCEINPVLAEQLNVAATRNVVDTIAKNSAVKLVYISTDAVYDGKQGNYREDAPVNPLSVYARTKYEGEQIAARRADSLIVRTSFFGWNFFDKRCFAERVLQDLAAKKNVPGFTDVSSSQIYTFDLAGLLEQALKKNLCGVYHFAGRTALSKYEFAVEVAVAAGLDASLIQRTSSDDASLKARRSKNLSLDTTKLARSLGTVVPTMPDSIRNFCKDFKTGLPQKIRP